MIVCVGDLATDLVALLEVDDLDPVSDTPAQTSLHRGGSAANVAAASIRVGRASRFVGAIGRDELHSAAAQSLAAAGVEVAGPSVSRGSAIIVLVEPSGHRRFVTDHGSPCDWGDVDPAWLANATRVHFTAYALCDPRATPACRQLAALAAQRGIPRSVDPSSVSVLRAFGTDRFCELVNEIDPDVVLPNADEARILGDGCASSSWRVITDGAGPTVVVGPAGERFEVEVPPLSVVDTTGAGDAFTAGFLAAFDQGKSPEVAVSDGHAAAARVVVGVGADVWQDERDV